MWMEKNKIKIKRATRLSATIAIKITIKLLINPLLRDSVKEAAKMGPGLAPPIRPKTKILKSWIKIPTSYSTKNMKISLIKSFERQTEIWLMLELV